MSDKIQIGLIGTSGYANILLTTLASCQDAEVAAICGRTRSRADEVAGKYRIPQVFTDYNEMIKHGRLDGIIIAAPDDLHYSMTMAALQAGLHVLCEKPMASTVAQAQQMLEAAEEAGVKHMIEFTWRWMPHYQYLHKLVADGYIGKGYHHHYRFLKGNGRTPDYKWQFDARRSKGVLGILGAHIVDLAIWINGDIGSVSAHLAAFMERTDPEGIAVASASESALLAVEFVDGAQGMIHASNVAHTADHDTEIGVALHGEKGTLAVDWRRAQGGKGIVMVGSRHDQRAFQDLTIPDGYLQGAEAGDIMAVFQNHLVGPRLFVDAILHNYIPEPSFAQGVKVQQVLDAALESHKTGRRVHIEM
jgi:predicted dehydrogenase